MNADQLIDDLADLLAPRLVERGFVLSEEPSHPDPEVSPTYDSATCKRFLEGRHMGDSVLERAEVLFIALAEQGEITSVELASALSLKGPKSLPANLTNPLKKSARRLRIEEPWEVTETADGTRTVWRDRDGIAARMVEEITAEWTRREPSEWGPKRDQPPAA
jgi:hypothetical protein